jgi:tRNA threonylcarbamoyl adenosine modification protein (Sua5/YciO/YrdC/YwlC family)
MFERLRLDPARPSIRNIRRAASLIREGLAAVVPTEATYALMCLPESNDAVSTIRRIRRLDEHHLWSLVCADLSQASEYVNINNPAHRILRRLLPGPYTCILPASARLPRRIFGRRRDIGIRIPDHTVCRSLLAELGSPLLATTLQFPDEEYPANDPDDFSARLRKEDMVILDAGWCGITTTTVLDLGEEPPELIRAGLGTWPV